MNDNKTNITQTHHGTGHNIVGNHFSYTTNESTLNRDISLAMLIGGWNESIEHDIQIIESLTGSPYREWIKRIQEALEKPDTPIKHHLGIWEITERRSYWDSILSRLYKEDLERFESAAIQVFSKLDPALQLAPETRYASAAYGIIPTNSPLLRKGFAETLALLSTFSKSAVNVPHYLCATLSYRVVSKTLTHENWEHFASVSDIISTLAEAAPEAFLKQIQKLLTSSKPILSELFKQSQLGGTHATPYIYGFISALERLAWFPDHLTHSLLALGELQTLDQGGNQRYSPLNSIVNILSPDNPRTTADFARRMVALEVLANETPEVAWPVLLQLLPQRWSSRPENSRPQFLPVTIKPHDRCIDKILEEQASLSSLTIKIARLDSRRSLEIAKNLDTFLRPPHDFKSAIDCISKTSEIIDEDEKYEIWSTLSSLAKSIKTNPYFRDIRDTPPEAYLQSAITKVSSKNPTIFYRKLFSNNPLENLEQFSNFEEQELKINNLTHAAIKEIYGTGDFKLISQFALKIDNPALAGRHLAALVKTEHADDLKELITHPHEKMQQFISSYIKTRNYKTTMEFLKPLNLPTWNLRALVKLFTTLPLCPATWQAVELLSNPELTSKYWQTVDIKWPGYIEYTGPAPLYTAIDKFLNHNRPTAALHCILHLLFREKTITTQAIIAVLKSFLTTQIAVPPYHDDIIKLIDILRTDKKTNPDELHAIEFAYCQILQHGKSDLSLHWEISKNATLFHDLICSAYPSDEDSLTQEEATWADICRKQALTIFGFWKIIPGHTTTFDAGAFEAWTSQAIALSDASGHSEIALKLIAQLLVHSPQDSSDLWINRSIADFLNQKNMEILRSHYVTATLDSRGVHIIEPNAAAEIRLAEKYKERAEQCDALGLFRFASSLREVSNYYSDFATTLIRGDTKLFDTTINERHHPQSDD
ncbi:hypothetical protein KSS94_08175 [Pseudomonas fakonensis]|uniref:Uncharacterized protein n=1 Tax=Pseudomonas fakonensis TaxID=2842355 RepID=A0ABX8NB45_9PSED|nr:hypothetical protein [Pseudomonas fakonensis]QXH53080.1 hypothetical protein KSS94_08175 [Pseudomonas fakonensis]